MQGQPRNIPVHVSKYRDYDTYSIRLTRQKTLTTINTFAKDLTDSDLPPTFLNFALLNAHSVRNKTTSVYDFILDQKLDVLAPTETWLRDDITDRAILGEIIPPGFNILNVPRKDRSGGGVALIFRDCFQVVLKPSNQCLSVECLDVELKLSSSVLRIVLLYCPEPKTGNSGTSNSFLEIFSDLLDDLFLASGKLLLLGDFNYHMDNPTDKCVEMFQKILNMANLNQHVTSATHVQGHILDLVITRHDELLISDLSINHTFPSDHFAVLFKVQVQGVTRNSKLLKRCRKYKNIDLKQFKSDILSTLYQLPSSDLSVNDLVDHYHHTLLNLIDKHAPVCSVHVKVSKKAEWYNGNIHKAKLLRKRYERQWLKSGKQEDLNAFKNQRNLVKYMLNDCKRSWYKGKIESLSNDTDIFKITSFLLNSKQTSTLPTYTSASDLAEKFALYFNSKVLSIRQTLSAIRKGCSLQPVIQSNGSTFSVLKTFPTVTVTEVISVIQKMPTRSYPYMAFKGL